MTNARSAIRSGQGIRRVGTPPVTSFARWVDEDRDLGVWLPYLSAYMGHATYTATAYYVHLLPQRIAATGLTAAAGIIPEPPL